MARSVEEVAVRKETTEPVGFLRIWQLTERLNRIILLIPDVVIGTVIIVVGSLIAKFPSGLVQSSASELLTDTNADH